MNKSYTCVLTDKPRAAKPKHVVITTRDNRLVVLRNGANQPFPKGLRLIIKGKVAKHLNEHLNHLMTMARKGAKALADRKPAPESVV